ncbi:hypothetical protein TSUD_207460 [Trifolium subterraneum]|uniref:Uncharacterized protein n=1 Tax=Trifolium subterraneum TaxID=3900 RepID=A0A2Z6NKP5_TRISU|nr:hypothetical protein TSUD_207460 [Trifolium subterraneum]
MSDRFSPALRIGDLNDFIRPSQACTVSRLKKVQVRQVKSEPEPVQISLKDCLACSRKIRSKQNM